MSKAISLPVTVLVPALRGGGVSFALLLGLMSCVREAAPALHDKTASVSTAAQDTPAHGVVVAPEARPFETELRRTEDLARTGAWHDAEDAVFPVLDRDGPACAPDQLARLYSLAGTIFAKTERPARATQMYRNSLQVWMNPETASWLRQSEGRFEDFGRSNLAVESVGRAVFYLAKQRSDALLADSAAPDYDGPSCPPLPHDSSLPDGDPARAAADARRAAVQAFDQQWVGPWTIRRERALRIAAQEYAEIDRIPPSPPIRWQVAAAFEVGRAWLLYSRELRQFPCCDIGVGCSVEPERQAAIAWFEYCLELARHGRHFDGIVRSCERSLFSEHEAPSYGEFMPMPGLRGIGHEQSEVRTRDDAATLFGARP